MGKLKEQMRLCGIFFISVCVHLLILWHMLTVCLPTDRRGEQTIGQLIPREADV